MVAEPKTGDQLHPTDNPPKFKSYETTKYLQKSDIWFQSISHVTRLYHVTHAGGGQTPPPRRFLLSSVNSLLY